MDKECAPVSPNTVHGAFSESLRLAPSGAAPVVGGYAAAAA